MSAFSPTAPVTPATAATDDGTFDRSHPAPEFPDCYAASTPTPPEDDSCASAVTTLAAAGYSAEASHLARAYTHAVGWALQYGIPVHRTSPVTGENHARALGDLRDDIRAHEDRTGVTARLRAAVTADERRRQALLSRWP